MAATEAVGEGDLRAFRSRAWRRAKGRFVLVVVGGVMGRRVSASQAVSPVDREQTRRGDDLEVKNARRHVGHRADIPRVPRLHRL